MSNSQTMAKDPSRTRMKKRKGHASVLHAADVRRVVNERVAANGPERVSLRGRALADADAVEAVCDAVLALGGVGQNSDDDAASATFLGSLSASVSDGSFEASLRSQGASTNLADAVLDVDESLAAIAAATTDAVVVGLSTAPSRVGKG